MTRFELIAELAAAITQLRGENVEAIVATIFDGIAAALARGDRVELRGFDAFTVRRRDGGMPTPRCCMEPALVVGKRAGTHMGKSIHLPETFALPFKYHAKHRHRVPKPRYRVTNRAEYDAALRHGAA